jgi:hypothetical protein
MVTLSPLAKCGAVDGYLRACISSLWSYNTERTTTCTLCNNRNLYVASSEIGIEGRMANNGYEAHDVDSPPQSQAPPIRPCAKRHA